MKIKQLVCRLVGHDHRGTNSDVPSSDPTSRYRVGQRPPRPSPTCHRCGFVDENLKPPAPPKPPPDPPPRPAMLPPGSDSQWLTRALVDLQQHLAESVGRKGMPDWSPHTALGKLTEEYHEFIAELHAKNGEAQAHELLDLANAALLAYICNVRQRRAGGLKTDAQQ